MIPRDIEPMQFKGIQFRQQPSLGLMAHWQAKTEDKGCWHTFEIWLGLWWIPFFWRERWVTKVSG